MEYKSYVSIRHTTLLAFVIQNNFFMIYNGFVPSDFISMKIFAKIHFLGEQFFKKGGIMTLEVSGSLPSGQTPVELVPLTQIGTRLSSHKHLVDFKSLAVMKSFVVICFEEAGQTISSIIEKGPSL